MKNYFSEISDDQFEGFIVATTKEVRAARRSTLKPAAQAPEHSATISTGWNGSDLQVTVAAKNYLHELSVLPEIVGLGTQVDTQMVHLLPGETHTFTITGPRHTLEEVERRVEDLVWSHNRVISHR